MGVTRQTGRLERDLLICITDVPEESQEAAIKGRFLYS